MKTTTLLMLTSLLGLTQCNLFDWNDDDQAPVVNQLDLLPPLTHEGKFTFGCLVNGKAWVPRTTVDMVAIYQEGVLQIGTELIFEGAQQGIGFIIRDENLRAQTYKLDSRDRFGQFGDDKLKCAYTTNFDNPGVLNITYFDQEKLIIAGTFAFEGVSRDCQDTVIITDGRFDMHYVP